MSNKVKIRLSRKNCVYEQQGFHGFKAKAEPGTYFVSDHKREHRGLFIQVLPNYQTQIFITYWRQPVIEEAGIFFSEIYRGFIPEDQATLATDLAIRGLINGVEQIPLTQMNYLLHGKFESPMLGLLAAFTILMRDDPNWELLDTVCGNLNYMIRGSVDLEILKAVLSSRSPTGQKWEYQTNLQYPPMLRSATDWAIKLTWENIDCIRENSLFEDVTLNLDATSAWTIWKPTGKREKDIEARNYGLMSTPRRIGLKSNVMRSAPKGAGHAPGSFEVREATQRSYIISSTEQVKVTKRSSGKSSGTKWIQPTITEWLSQTKQDISDVNEIALSKSLGLPKRIVIEALKELSKSYTSK